MVKTLKYNNTRTRGLMPSMLNIIRERACKVISLFFSKLYYVCVVDDSGDRIFVLERNRDN